MKIELPGGAIYNGDCLEILKDFPDNSIDALVTDPPYGLSFMGKKWDYDVPSVELWQEVLRVLKPGAHGLVACGTRTQHRMAVNLEDAGFEIRDVIMWVYGSGFPKSLNIGKAIDQIQGNEREQLKTYTHCGVSGGIKGNRVYVKKTITRGVSIFEGYGTALKPAVELFTLVRKPISEKNIAENVLRWGTGGMNIDGCKVGSEERTYESISYLGGSGEFSGQNLGELGRRLSRGKKKVSGRFPANLIHDGSEEVLDGFPESVSVRSVRDNGKGEREKFTLFTGLNKLETVRGHNDQGSAARFFYCAKASPSERNEGLEGLEEKKAIGYSYGNSKDNGGMFENRTTTKTNHHPTVKPIALMQYLIRLITPPFATVLDPFAGSGTTGIAAVKEGKEFILIEREPEYIEIATARVKHHINKIEPDLFTAAANA